MWTPNPYYEKYIAHYGTKGMKWGVVNEDDEEHHGGPGHHESAPRSTTDKRTIIRRFVRGDKNAMVRSLINLLNKDPNISIKNDIEIPEIQPNKKTLRSELNKRKDQLIKYLQSSEFDKDDIKYLLNLLDTAESEADLERAIKIVGKVLGHE